MALPTRTNPQVPPKYGPVIPSTPVQTPSHQTGVPKKQQIVDLISHIARSDNHLWQALNSLQNQTNSIVGSSTEWTSWNPKIADDQNPSMPVPTVELSAYFMTMGSILFISVYSQALTINSSPSPRFITVDLPVDIGDTIIRTCSAYLIPTNPAYLTHNGIIGVEMRKRTAMLTIDSALRTQICRFMMGGAIGIVQGSGHITATI